MKKNKKIDQDIDEDFDLDTEEEKEIEEKEEDDLEDKDDDLFSDDLGFDEFDDTSQTSLKKHSDLLKSLTNFAPFIKDKVNGWLGLRWSEEDQKYVRDPNVEPIMNQKCAAWCIDYLKTYTRENNIITNIGKDEYKNIVLDIIDVVWTDLGCRSEYFGITNNGDLHRICVEMQHASELILMGAGDGKYNQFLGSATSRHETINLSEGQQQERMGMVRPKKANWLNKIKAAMGGT